MRPASPIKGRKINVYVPPEDLSIIDSINKLCIARRKMGLRTSFGFELLRLTKLGYKTLLEKGGDGIIKVG